MTDLRTISPDELSDLSEVPEDLRAVVFSPGGALQSLPYEQLLTKLIATDLAKPSKAALDADLAHPLDSVALVFSDPVATQNGWYRKLGVAGAGSWSQFEELSRNSRIVAQSAALAAAQSAVEAGGFSTPEFASQAAGQAATSPGQVFRVPIGTVPQTFNWFRRTASGSEPVAPLASSAALSGPGGAALIGKQGGGNLQRAAYVTDQALTLEEFGGKADYVNPGNRGTDNYSALMQALDAINRYAPVNGRWARVPRIELDLGAYFFGQQLDLKIASHLRGQGSGHDDFNGGTRFVFPAATKGVTVNDSNTAGGSTTASTTSALGTVIEGLQIESEGGGTGWDTTRSLNDAGVLVAAGTNTCGLWVRATATLRDIVLKGWKGNPIQIIGDVSQGGALRGNASGTIVDRLTVREDDAGTPGEGFGILVYGKDVNACDFTNVQVRHAGLAGIVDANTLGNTWTNPRVDDFGRVARATAAAELGAFFGGVNYILIDDRPGLGAATVPGTNPQIWYPVEAAGAASALFPAWINTANYVCMLPFLFLGQSNTGTVENPYIEGGFPGHAGGNPSAPGTGVTVYGGQSQWTRFTSRLYSVPSYGRAAASNSGWLSRRVSDIGTAEVADFGAYSQARIGSGPGEIWAGRTARDGEADYAMRFTTAGELVLDRGGGGLPLMRISTTLTARQFGAGANVPYVVSFPNFALSDPADSGNDRRVSMGLAAPTAGLRARGDRVWNAQPGPGRPDYWECIATGTPGTWIGVNVMPFQSGAAGAALTGSTSETVLATLTLPGGTLGPNGSIQADALFSVNNSAGAKTVRFRFGGISGMVFGASVGSTSIGGRATGLMQNRNNISAQIGSANNAFVAATTAHNTGALNTANAQDIVITGQLATGTDSITLEGYSIRIEPGS